MDIKYLVNKTICRIYIEFRENFYNLDFVLRNKNFIIKLIKKYKKIQKITKFNIHHFAIHLLEFKIDLVYMK